MKLYILSCLLTISTFVGAQGLSGHEVDSLWQIIRDGEFADEKHIDILHVIAENKGSERDAAIEELNMLQPKTKIRKAQRDAVLGRVLYLKNQFPEASKATKRSMTALRGMDDSQEFVRQLKVDNLRNLGNINSVNGDFQGAIDYFLKALEVSGYQFPESECNIYLGIGYVYDRFEKREEAKIYFERSLSIALEHQINNSIAEAYHGLGRMASNLYKLERADSLYEISLVYLDTTRQRLKRYGIYCSQAMVKEKKKEFDVAIPMFVECADFYKKENNMVEYADMNLHLGYTTLAQGKYEESATRCQVAYKLFSELGYAWHSGFSAGCLGDSYYGLKDYEKAFIYNDRHWMLYDSLQKVENQVKVTREIGEAERKKDKKLYDEQLKRRNSILALLFSFLLISVFAYRIKIRDNKKIKQQNEQLDELNGIKDRIFGIIGHDLKKPAIAFRGITKKVNYLLKKKEYDRLLVLGESIEKDANDLNILTDNLLKWALLQREILPNDATEANIEPIVEEVFSLFDRVAAEKNIRMTAHIPPDHKVLADKNALSTIIRNLVDNAVKFTPKGGEVVVSTTETKDGILISIRDSGVGMHEDKIKDIFLLKKEKTTEGTSGEKGTGLGLHLVGELIKQSKGSVEVESQIGEGTEFRIMLPQVA